MASKSSKKPQNGMATMKRLFRYVFKQYKVACFFIVVFITISSLTSVASSLFLKTLIDQYITPLLGVSDPSFTPLLQALLTMGCIYFSGVVSAYLYGKILVVVAQGTLNDVRKDLFAHMEKLPIQYFDTHSHGETMSVYTNDVDTLRQMISQSVPQMLSSAITIVGVFVSMLFLSLPLTGIVVVMVIIIRLVTIKLAGLSGSYFTKQQKNLGTINGYIEEMLEGQKVIKVFTQEEKVKQDFDVLNEELFESANNANKYGNMLMPILGNLGNLSYVFTALFGGLLAIYGNGVLSLGALASFLQLNRSFTMPISQVSQQLNAVVMALAGAERIFNLLDETPELDEGKVTLTNMKEQDGVLVETTNTTKNWAWKHLHEDGSIDYVPVNGDVRFDDVSFSYAKGKKILKNIDLFANPGQKIAFVGATGAGKTTITNLINRFYDIQEGSITYDGIDIKLIKKDDLRRSLGIVLQDTHLFSGTIMDNIRYGKPEASEEEVIAASKLANAHSFVKHLEGGYQHFITADGGSLSQGQRQLLSIARAALVNSPVLILDEATSSIDSRTEMIVQAGMDNLMSGRTVFVIAHRLSTIKNADAIMVMEQGRIIERGNHRSLLDERGVYYQLCLGGLELD